jgi:hypothetical protein
MVLKTAYGEEEAGLGRHRETETLVLGSGIAQAVSRRLPTAAAWVRTRVMTCEICGEQSGTVARIFRVLRLPCQFSFRQMLHTHLSSGVGTTSQLVADVPIGLSLTPPHNIKNK